MASYAVACDLHVEHQVDVLRALTPPWAAPSAPILPRGSGLGSGHGRPSLRPECCRSARASFARGEGKQRAVGKGPPLRGGQHLIEHPGWRAQCAEHLIQLGAESFETVTHAPSPIPFDFANLHGIRSGWVIQRPGPARSLSSALQVSCRSTPHAVANSVISQTPADDASVVAARA